MTASVFDGWYTDDGLRCALGVGPNVRATAVVAVLRRCKLVDVRYLSGGALYRLKALVEPREAAAAVLLACMG